MKIKWAESFVEHFKVQCGVQCGPCKLGYLDKKDIGIEKKKNQLSFFAKV